MSVNAEHFTGLGLFLGKLHWMCCKQCTCVIANCYCSLQLLSFPLQAEFCPFYIHIIIVILNLWEFSYPSFSILETPFVQGMSPAVSADLLVLPCKEFSTDPAQVH